MATDKFARSAAFALALGFTLAAPGIAAAQTPQRVDVSDSLFGMIYRPQGTGPFPAVVAMHGCSGLGNSRTPVSDRHAEWGEALARKGFVVLFPDSFRSRGLGSQCRVRDRGVRASRERIGDAHAALAWLATQRDVKPGSISLMGWSNGGSSVLYAIQERHAPKGQDFAAAVALYPGCKLLDTRKAGWVPRVPLLVLAGEADDWTPASFCVSLVRRAKAAGHDARIVTYPGAYHSFDLRDRPVRVSHGLAFTGDGGGSAHAGTNTAARDDVFRRVPDFLAK